MKVNITTKKFYLLNRIDPRIYKLTPSNLEIVEVYEETIEGEDIITSTINIIQLKFSKNKRISVGDELTVDGKKFTVNIIQAGPKQTYYLLESFLTKSAKYILPLIADKGKHAENYMFKSALVNTYINCNLYPEYSDMNHLFICYKFEDNDMYKRMEQELMVDLNYVDIKEPNTELTIFIYEIPKMYHFTVNQFFLGEYHNFDPPYKTQILDFFNPTKSSSPENYTQLYKNRKEAFERNKQVVKKLEANLAIELPEHIGIESRPLIKEETLIL